MNLCPSKSPNLGLKRCLELGHQTPHQSSDEIVWGKTEVKPYQGPRKIIQIAVPDGDGLYELVALCNDGTIWNFYNGWTQHPPIPQPKETNE